MQGNLLIEAYRGEVVEASFYGWVLVVNSRLNILRSLTYSDNICYMRSCEKPLQALCSKKFNAIDKYNIIESEIAMSYSSHTGSSEHINQLENILNKTGVSQNQLHCGIHPPIDKEERHRLIREGIKPSVLHNNCSAKHLFVLASCKASGWPLDNYTDPAHPVQREIIEIVKYYCQTDTLKIGIDGCSMPIHAMPLLNMGAGFAKYFDGSTEYAEILADAVSKYPHLAGGYGRIDSAIIQSSDGKLLAKVGAEGLIIVTARHTGEALVVKLSCGNDYMRNYVVIEALKQLNWLANDPLDDELLKPFSNQEIYNHAGKNIGKLRFKFVL
ncbi:MAG: asparaginase [Cyanobacteriota bacterium]